MRRALVATLLAHGLAMLAMAVLLLPALPGGGQGDLARVAYVASHPWSIRLGWLPWQLCALADLWLAVALLRSPGVSRPAGAFVLLCTASAVVPDQWAQIAWGTRGVSLAGAAVASGGPGAYLAFERAAFEATAGWAALLYTLAGVGWTWCFVRAGLWSRTLTWLGVVLWPLMAALALAALAPAAFQVAPLAIALGSGLGFVLLMGWLALVAEALLRRERPFQTYGRDAPWRHPGRGLLGRLTDVVANSRLADLLADPVPLLALVSDVTDVVYVSYVVPAERLLPLCPEGLELQRLGRSGEHALFTFLTFRHGHFGFAFLGPLRRLLPSSTQSNWRIHVRDPRTRAEGVHFVTNATTSTAHALAARLLAEAMPMHVLARGEVRRSGDGEVRVTLEPGAGTAPDCAATLRPCATPALPASFAACFASFRDFLAYAVPQDRAMSTQPHRRRVTRQEIDLGIPLDACEPLAGEVVSRAARALVGDAEPVCFRVPALRFRFAAEAHDPLPCGP